MNLVDESQIYSLDVNMGARAVKEKDTPQVILRLCLRQIDLCEPLFEDLGVTLASLGTVVLPVLNLVWKPLFLEVLAREDN